MAGGPLCCRRSTTAKSGDGRFDAFMISHDQPLAQFRSQIAKRLQEVDREWDASRRLIETSHLVDTLHRLIERVRTSDLPPAIQDSLLTALNQGKVQRVQDLSG